MIQVLSNTPIRVQNFEFTQSMDCVGTKISFHTPEFLPVSAPLQVFLHGKLFFTGKVEARSFSFSPKSREGQYGGRDLLTIRLDTCPHPKSYAKGVSFSHLMKDLCPDVPFEVRGNLPPLPAFSIDPGETLLEVLQTAGKKVGASVFVSNGKLIFAKDLRKTTVSFGPHSDILSLEVEENVSKIFDELIYLEGKPEAVKDPQKKIRRKKVLTLSEKKEKTDGTKEKVRQKHCAAIRNSFSCSISCSESKGLEPYDLVSVHLPNFLVTGEFVVSDIRYSLSQEEERMCVTLRKPEGF